MSRSIMNHNISICCDASRHVVERVVSSSMSQDVMTGTVKWFDTTKGYGFIGVEGQEKDIFVHYTAIEGSGRRDLYKGDQVEFQITEGLKGPQAQNVRKL